MRRARALLVVSCLFVALVFTLSPAGSDHPFTCPSGAADTGCWLPPFSEDGPDEGSAGDFNERPPGSGSSPAGSEVADEESARFPTAVSLAVLPNGKVVYWNGIEGSEDLNGPLGTSIPKPEESRTRLLDLSAYLTTGADPRTTATWSVPTPEDGGGGDLFCADQRHLTDGRVLVVGGTDWVTVAPLGGPPGTPEGAVELFGRKNARVYDPNSNTWTQASDMNKGRWYPTLVTLPDGHLFVASGVGRLIYNAAPGAIAPGEVPGKYPAGTGDNVVETEIYDPNTNIWKLNGPSGNQSLPLFARLHLLPNGKIFFDATGQMWGPFGESIFQPTWNFNKWYDPTTNTWENLSPALNRSGVFSALLPLRPNAGGDYDSAEILIGGGTLGGPPGTLLATAVTEKVTWSASNPDTVTRRQLSDMNVMRWYSSGIVLPSGEVLALSGADKDEVVEPGAENAVRQAEMWDPETETWTVLSSAERERTYHNSAVLLPDGSVLVGGHSPIVHSYGERHRTTNANNFKDPSFEIFKPPYLFRGDRPVITHAAPAKMNRNGVYPIGVKGSAQDSTLKVVLSRLPATTHITDADQRTVEVPIVHRGDNSVIQVKLPASGAVLPPGYYYLFLIKDNGGGPTPSHAQIVQIQ